MTQSLKGERLLIATHNKGKLEEFRQLLEPYGVEVASADELALAEPEETENTFLGNARIKAQAAMKASGMITLSDDSGLCVDALNGDPGVYTADWAGPARDWNMAMRLVEEKLQASGALSSDKRTGAFNCTLVVLWPNGDERVFVGKAPGQLVWPPRGKLGHGYDPVFVPEGQDQTFAEMTHEKKNALSHRGHALSQLLKELF